MALEKGESVARIELTKEQVEAIQKATGVKVSQLDLIRVSGEAARAVSPHLVAGVLAVPCW